MSETTETRPAELTEAKARALFEKTCARLHEAGWDVIAVMEKAVRGESGQIIAHVKVGGEPAQKRATFLRMVEYVAPVKEDYLDVYLHRPGQAAHNGASVPGHNGAKQE